MGLCNCSALRIFNSIRKLTCGKRIFFDHRGFGRRPLQFHAHAACRNTSGRISYFTGMKNKNAQFEFLANQPNRLREIRIICDDNSDFIVVIETVQQKI